MNITAYLEMLARLGIRDGDMPVPQPAFQQRAWERFQPGEGPDRLAAVIGEPSAEDGRLGRGIRSHPSRAIRPNPSQLITTGGMPGRQIILIAITAALLAATAAVALDRARARRRTTSTTG